MTTRPNAEALGPFGHTLGEPLPDDAEPLGGLYVSRFTAGIWIVELIGVPEFGVCNIRASRRVETNEFGHQAVTTADEVVQRITEKYGEPDVTHDYLLDGSLWTEPRDWMTALLKKDRVWIAHWLPSHETINTITVLLTAESELEAELSVTYQSSDYGECLKIADANAGISF